MRHSFYFNASLFLKVFFLVFNYCPFFSISVLINISCKIKDVSANWSIYFYNSQPPKTFSRKLVTTTSCHNRLTAAQNSFKRRKMSKRWLNFGCQSLRFFTMYFLQNNFSDILWTLSCSQRQEYQITNLSTHGHSIENKQRDDNGCCIKFSPTILLRFFSFLLVNVKGTLHSTVFITIAIIMGTNIIERLWT